jgi:hypothetical protein
MRLMFIVVFLLMSFSAFSQKVVYIKGKTYKGYIFPENFDVLLGVQNQSGKFTPDSETIKNFECQLYIRVKELTKQLPNQGIGCPKIKKSTLRKYTRQYFGFTTKNGEHVLFVNFVWSKNIEEITKKLHHDLVNVHDGCTHYWRIQYNITKDEFSGLDVNIRS